MASFSKPITTAASQAPASIPSPVSFRPRRDSLASASTASQTLAHSDKERLTQTLDKIHTSASQSESLTTFNDFTNPPGAAPTSESRNAGEIVQQGLSGLYTRFREVVGGAVGTSKVSQEEHEEDVLAMPNKRSSIQPDYNASKSPVTSLHRADATAALKPSTPSEEGLPVPTSTANVPTLGPDGQQHPQHNPKAINVSLASGIKTPTSGRQSLPASINSGITAPPGVTASAELPASRDGSRMPTRRDDASARLSTRKSTNKAETHPLASPSDTSSAFEYKDKGQSRKSDGLIGADGNTDTATASSSNPQKLPPLQTSDLRGVATSSSALSLAGLRNAEGNGRGTRSPAQSTSQSSSVDVATGQTVLSGQHAGAVRMPFNPSTSEPVTVKLAKMKRQVLSKEFWMKDETCKECFHCATPFTAFRRKHHCRTCGCIFDSKCTSIISGQEFGVQGSIRVCKTCLDIINRRSGFDSDDSGDETYLPAIFRPSHTRNARGVSPSRAESSETHCPDYADVEGARSVTAPMMAIPAARRIGESSNRNSAVLEIDAPHLSRPSSSRSLKSLAARPQSSGHKRHHSKHNLLGRFRPGPPDDRAAPFRKGLNDEISQQKQKLPAFHDDNIIDPELAAYMSDESSGDEQMSIFATMNVNDLHAGTFDNDRVGPTPYLSTGKGHRRRQGDKSISGLSFAGRPFDDANPMASMASHQRPVRRRNLSNVSGSGHHLRSPRPKSGIFNSSKGPSASNETLLIFDKENLASASETPTVTRSGSMSKSGKPNSDLNPASLQHAKKLLHQLLQDAQIPNLPAWEKALTPILLRSTEDVDPDIKGAGDFMDIRKYVKIKKIPGARTGDTSYVSGVIFTKKLALKSMPRNIKHPRIVIITFPIEYHRHQQHFMSLQPVIEQEREYLRLVVNRIIKFNPQVVLTEKGVSGVALQYLAEANIAVAYNVNPRVLDAVARCTAAQQLSSVDMLSLELTPGVCESFEVRTYVNNDFPGKKKSYIFLSGCNKSLGCTIALRGASVNILAKVKIITEFMVYVVYNMKLEYSLMRDSNICLPSDAQESPPRSNPTRAAESVRSASAASGYAPSVNANGFAVVVDPATDSEPPTQASMLTVSTVTTDSSPKSESAEGQSRPRPELVSAHESHMSHGSHDSQVPEDVPMPTYYSDMIAKYETKLLSASPLVKFTQPYLLMKAREQERRLVYLKRLRDQDMVEQEDKSRPQRFQLIDPTMIHAIGQKAPAQIMEVLHAAHDAEYDKALHNYQIQTKQWESYIQGNLDLFDPYSHQNVVVLHSMTCTETKIPCVEPHLIALAFYEQSTSDEGMDTDITIGQFIEGQCLDKDAICDMSGCDKKMSEHHRTYVHDHARVTIFVEHIPMPDPVPPGRTFEDITMWSYCKLCEKDSPQVVMAPNTWKYSFGKYLESLFWIKSLRMSPEVECPHEHYRDHIRYFTYRDGRVRIHYDPIDLLEIVGPRARITWKVENDLKLKNQLFTSIQERWCRFVTSVQSRLRSITIDSVLPDKAAACKAELERLAKKTQDDQVLLVRKLQEIYVNSKYYEVTPFNIVIRDMMLKSAEWDSTFAKFEADFLGDKDLKQLTIIQLRKIFSDDEAKESVQHVEGGPLPSVADGDEKTTQDSSMQDPPEIDEKLAGQHSDTAGSVDVDGGGDLVKTNTQVSADEEAKVTMPVATGVLENVDPLDLAMSELPEPPRHVPHLQPMMQKDEESIGEPEDFGACEPAVLSKPETAPLLVVAQSHPERISEGSSVNVSPDDANIENAISSIRTTYDSETFERAELSRRDTKSQAESSTESSTGSEQSRLSGPPLRAIPERSSSRRMGVNPSALLNRTQSQPGRPTLARAHTGSAKMSGPKDKTSQMESGSSESDLVVKVDKKLADRLVGALKTHRKSGQSSIPRLIHKRRESKVSTLAKHFEQLSREFERERIKDRKKRGGQLAQRRAALPRTSTKAIVEVYDDVNEAVQEPGPSDLESVVDKDTTGKSSGPPTVGGTEASTEMSTEMSTEVSAEAASGEASAAAPSPAPSESQPVEGDDTGTVNNSIGGSDDDGAGSDGDRSILDDLLPDVNEIADSLQPNTEIPLELPKHQKISLMKMLTNFWTERSASSWPQLEYPLSSSEHLFMDSDIIVREDEPSSLIAFALSSEDYREKLATIRRNCQDAVQDDNQLASGDATTTTKTTTTAKMGGTMGVLAVAEASNDTVMLVGEAGPSSPRSATESDSGELGRAEVSLETSLLRSTGTHLKYQFREGSATMMCKIFYAEQFDALRHKCGVADRFIESLSRCIKWDSRGGKTKSTFLKTLDDRWVCKSLSPIETAAFLRFAPSYFGIMAEVLFHDLPSVIAKMLGFFQIIIKNPTANTEIKLDLLVMENLFYDRTPSRIFDLKGSMRNRKIQSTGEQNEVLLDENMVEYIYESPLFAREHSKKLLRASVWNDTLFLARQNVMDYSLMVAVDAARKELVVGIIDCIRTYTWDKKLESWIKDRGFAGGGRNRPTVTSPKDYKSRFREAMARYILQAPNCWHQFSRAQMQAVAKLPFEDDEKKANTTPETND